MVRLVEQKRLKARKEHVCDSCYRKNILRGEEYKRQFCVDSGVGYTYKECEDCETANEYIYDIKSLYVDEYPRVIDYDEEDVAAIRAHDSGLAQRFGW